MARELGHVYQRQLYTRNGNFSLKAGGQLVTSAGNPVLTDAGAAITFANDETGIAIARDGTITSDQGQRGKLAIVTFDNPKADSYTPPTQSTTTIL